MLNYWWYRHYYWRQEFEKDAKVDVFATYYLSTNLGRIKERCDRIRENVRELRSKRATWSDARDKLLRDGRLLQDAEFHNVGSKYRRLFLVLGLIALSESGLNYFTAMIAIPATGILSGLVGTLLRTSVAITVTVFAILGAEQLFEELLPSKKYGRTPEEAARDQQERSSWVRVVLWSIILIGTEYMIYRFGLARVHDIEGGKVNPDTAQALIVLSMIVPIVGGGIAWELTNIRDAYKNRLLFDGLGRRINDADITIEKLCARENSYFQEETNDWWRTFNRIKSFKEYFNAKKGRETPPLDAEHRFATDHVAFYNETLALYNQHKEKQDALGKLKIDASAVASIVGGKIGQDRIHA